MPVCTAGSERKPEAPLYLHLDPAYASSLLPLGVQWLLPYIPYVEAIDLSLDDFCSIDPPTFEIPTALELLSLVSRTPYATALVAGFKVAQILHYVAWYTFCRCSDGDPLPAPSYPSAPADLPTVNPPSYAPSPGFACRTDVGEVTTTFTSYLGPYTAWPVGATSYRFTAVVDNPEYAVLFGILPYDADPDTVPNSFNHRGNKLEFNGTFSPPATGTTSSGSNWWISPVPSGVRYRIQFGPNGSTGTHPEVVSTLRYSIEWFCGNDPTTPPVGYNPCTACPPDPFLQGQLAQLISALAIVREQVDLIQRQAVPFATVDGALHAGLTGEGEISVSSLIGARIGLVDTLEGTVTTYSGHPETLYGTGWIRWGDSAGWRPREFLDSEVTLSYPTNAGSLTKIGYSLPAGAEIDIVELGREP